jgi:hypothetical protein
VKDKVGYKQNGEQNKATPLTKEESTDDTPLVEDPTIEAWKLAEKAQKLPADSEEARMLRSEAERLQDIAEMEKIGGQVSYDL